MVLNNISKTIYISLLILAGIFICQYLIFLNVIDFGEFRQNNYQRESLYSLYLELFLAGMFIPIIEELGFRLFIGSRKKALIVSFVFYILLTISNFFNNIYLLALFAILGSILFCLPLVTKIKNSKNLTLFQLIFSSIIFSIFHFIQSSIPFLGFCSVLLYFTGMGLVFGIIRLNYGIVFSIVAHVIWNSVFIFFSIFNIDNTTKEVVCKDYKIEYSQSSIFGEDKNMISANEEYFKLQNGEIIQSIKIYFPQSTIKEYYQVNSLINYNIDVSVLQTTEIKIEELIECLVQENLIQKLEPTPKP